VRTSKATSSLAEIVLQAGSGIGGWLIALGYGLVLAVVPVGGCLGSGDETFRGTFVFGAIAVLTALMLELSMPWKKSLRWMAALAGALLIFAAYRISPFLQTATLEGGHLCRDLAPEPPLAAVPGWHLYWAPFHLSVIALLLLQALRTWRSSPASREAEPVVS